jgi:hypothetical protein
MDELREEHHIFLQVCLPPNSKKEIFYKDFGEKVKDTIKSLSTAAKRHGPKTPNGCVEVETIELDQVHLFYI